MLLLLFIIDYFNFLFLITIQIFFIKIIQLKVYLILELIYKRLIQLINAYCVLNYNVDEFHYIFQL